MKIYDLPYEFAMSVIMSDQLSIDNNYYHTSSYDASKRKVERIKNEYKKIHSNAGKNICKGIVWQFKRKFCK